MLDMYDMGGTLVLDYWAIVQVVASANPNSLKIMISGAPASGKGTQCELITKKVSFFYYLRASSLSNCYLIDNNWCK